MLLQSDKFKCALAMLCLELYLTLMMRTSLLLTRSMRAAGASMQSGIAVPKVCRAMIPHLRDNVVRYSLTYMLHVHTCSNTHVHLINILLM